jgi:alkanesulfonate monooxygenase SsuD/methylene tetrahydromethanopterin reductase-like flavin-dependent oxidoreductase (luciferase family)
VIPGGVGIVAAVARHPAVTAMEVASLARTYPGRFSAGIGTRPKLRLVAKEVLPNL